MDSTGSAPPYDDKREDDRRAMLDRLTNLERQLHGVRGPSHVHAQVAIETLRARLLGLMPPTRIESR